MACVAFHGSYDGIHAAGQALLNWIAANGFAIAGASREVYLRFGAQQDGYRLPAAYLAQTASDFVTELQIPVERAEGETYGALFGNRQAGSKPAERTEGTAG
jgi:effector-binding domain-containing protein